MFHKLQYNDFQNNFLPLPKRIKCTLKTIQMLGIHFTFIYKKYLVLFEMSLLQRMPSKRESKGINTKQRASS